jgi:site-specific DNA-methyltransferase (adenine-specific)
LKKNGSLWIIGAFQNIYRIGYILQELDMWIINDVIWNKTNPTPNFMGTRFTNSSETMIWCTKEKNSKYTFNYKTMKHLNGGKQMKSVWNIPLCTGKERLKNNLGEKLHNTQKPKLLLENIILSTSKVRDVVLDPFVGSGTTASIAKMYKRYYIGIEKEKKYIPYIEKRINNTKISDNDDLIYNTYDIKPKRVPIGELLKVGYLKENEKMYNKNGVECGVLLKDGKVLIDGLTYSIHRGSAKILGLTNNNGWDFWYVKRNNLTPIDYFRDKFRENHL